jgi:hypothetical protein
VSNLTLVSRLGILRANGNKLALELSRNKVEVRNVENDAEKSVMTYLEYKIQRANMEKKTGEKLTSSERDEIARKLAGGDKNLKACLQSELILTYWGSLQSVVEGRRFFNTKYFSSKWSIDTIHKPGGGVS